MILNGRENKIKKKIMSDWAEKEHCLRFPALRDLEQDLLGSLGSF